MDNACERNRLGIAQLEALHNTNLKEERCIDDPEADEYDVDPLKVDNLRTPLKDDDPIDSDIKEDPDYEDENDESVPTSGDKNVNNIVAGTANLNAADEQNACTVVIEETSHRRSRRKRPDIDTSTWVRNKRIKNREHGLAYNGVRREKNGTWNYKVKRDARTMKPACDCPASTIKKSVHCRMVTETMRQTLHDEFQKLSWNEKKVYICSVVDIVQTSRARDRRVEDWSRRMFSLTYHLRFNDKKYQVCKKMFLNTLAIGEWSVRNWKLKQHLEQAHDNVDST